jgi:hypothetical protein
VLVCSAILLSISLLFCCSRSSSTNLKSDNQDKKLDYGVLFDGCVVKFIFVC